MGKQKSHQMMEKQKGKSLIVCFYRLWRNDICNLLCNGYRMVFAFGKCFKIRNNHSVTHLAKANIDFRWKSVY